jgi:hypothetical protein
VRIKQTQTLMKSSTLRTSTLLNTLMSKGAQALIKPYILWQKNRIEARKWTAAKLKPRKYGERYAVEGVEGGAAIKTEDTGANKFLEIIKNMEMTKRAG